MANINTGAFLGTTRVLEDPKSLSQDQLKELTLRLYQDLNSVLLLLNIKDTGQYSPLEFVCGQQFLLGKNPSQVVRKMVEFGELPNATSKTVAHGIDIDAGYRFTRIYGTSSDPAGNVYLPLPYASSTLVNNVELSVDATNVTITTGINRTAFTTTYIVLEYLRFE